MRGRGWIVAVALAVIVAVLVLLVPNKPTSSPDHRSDSDAPDGTSAFYQLSSRLGHPTSQLKGSFGLPDRPGIMFVFSPADPFDESQAAQVERWVRDGGTLVYADAALDPNLANQFQLANTEAFIGGSTTGDNGGQTTITAATPVFAAVANVVTTSTVLETYDPKADQVPVLRVKVPGRRAANRAVGMLATRGRGRAFFLGDPVVLTNDLIGRADNGRLAAGLLALAPEGAPVRFDEFHHGGGATSPSVNDWVTTPWGAALAWALVVVFIGFLLRGRAFGPPIPILSTRDRSSAEYAAAVGMLLRRARARELTLKVVADATRRALAERTGLGRGVSVERLGQVLEQRAPSLAAELGAADALGAMASQSESALLRAARKLHALAYPSAKKQMSRTKR